MVVLLSQREREPLTFQFCERGVEEEGDLRGSLELNAYLLDLTDQKKEWRSSRCGIRACICTEKHVDIVEYWL
jgi:hypothetical protein